MKILVDALGYLSESRMRGIGRYTRDFIYSLLNRGHDIHVLLDTSFVPNAKESMREFSATLSRNNIHTWHSIPISDPYDTSSKAIEYNKVILRAKIREVAPDVVIFTEPMTHLATIVTDDLGGAVSSAIVYDVIPALYPVEYLNNPRLEAWYKHRLNSLSQFDILLTISEASKSEIEGVVPNVDVFNIGCDTSSKLTHGAVDPSKGRVRQLNTNAFLLYAGGYDPRKSIPFLIESIGRIAHYLRENDGIKLVLAGLMHSTQKSELELIVKKHSLQDIVVFLGYVSDESLLWLYRNCLVCLNPSKHEGFGLPILEAMRCGVPVLVAANSNSMELVTIEEARFLTGDQKSFTNQLTKLIESPTLRDKIVQYGFEKQRQYSWENVGRSTIDCLESLLREKGKICDRVFRAEELYSELAKMSPTAKDARTLSKSINRTILPCRRQILVDVSILVSIDSQSGIQRVSRSMFNALKLIVSENVDVNPVYFCTATGYFKYALIDHAKGRFLKSELEEPVDLAITDLFIGLDLNHNLAVNHQEALNKLLYSDARVCFIVYDLLPIRRPDWFDEKHNLSFLHRLWIERVSKADNLMCISKSVADDLQSYIESQRLGHQYLDVGWFHLGSDIENSMPSRGVPENFANQLEIIEARTSILMVGTIEPRKGYEAIVAAVEGVLNAEDFNLVIVGRPGWKSDALLSVLNSHSDSGRHLFWFSNLSDEALERLYSACSGLIAASYDEGFGLPIIEAARYGLPVLARDIPVFREVGKDYATYFYSDEVGALQTSILDWVRSIENRAHKHSNQVKPLTWSESAFMLLSRLSHDNEFGVLD